MTDPSIRFGTPLSEGCTRVLLLGAGEVGKEVTIGLQRFGVEVIAVDRYADAPAMQLAHRSHGIPTARAARLTMDRESIRRQAAEVLKLPASPHRFADSEAEYCEAITVIGLPCVVKPVMSLSGKGQSTLRGETDTSPTWEYAQAGRRTGAGRVIVRKRGTTASPGSRNRCRRWRWRPHDSGPRLFGKLKIVGLRRRGVALARAEGVDGARAKATRAAAQVKLSP